MASILVIDKNMSGASRYNFWDYVKFNYIENEEFENEELSQYYIMMLGTRTWIMYLVMAVNMYGKYMMEQLFKAKTDVNINKTKLNDLREDPQSQILSQSLYYTLYYYFFIYWGGVKVRGVWYIKKKNIKYYNMRPFNILFWMYDLWMLNTPINNFS